MKINCGFFFLFLFLLGCQRDLPKSDIPLTTLKPQLFVSQNGKKIPLIEINRNETHSLDLSDEIIFTGLTSSTPKPANQKAAAESKKSEKNLLNMKIFSTCLMKDKKHTVEKELTHYQSHFYILDLLPEKILLNYKKNTQVSCSFLFIIRDKKKNEYLYSLGTLPVLSVGNDVSLRLVNDKNEKATEQLIDADNMSRFDLILQKDKKASKIKFLCQEEKKKIHFNLSNSESVISPFKFLQSLQKEQLPSGKQICRILTYGKNRSANGVTGPFQIDFKTLYEKMPQPEEPLSPEKKPELFVSQKGKRTALTEINKDKNNTLTLSDEIIFTGLNRSNELKSGSSEKPVNMEISTSCLMNNKKYPSGKKLSNYQNQFYTLDLLPEAILLNYKKSYQVSCSFSFIIRDKKKNEHLYNLPFLPILSVENNVFLKLLNDTNEEIETQQLIDGNNMNSFNLIILKNKVIKKIKFLCEEEKEKISFNLTGNVSVISPFKFLQSLKKENLPSGKKKCRILTYGKNHSAHGITGFFKIDFKNLIRKKSLWIPHSLKVEIDLVPENEMSEYSRRKSKGKGRENAIHIIGIFEIPGLFDQLPKKFTKEDYQSHKIVVHTKCYSPLFFKDNTEPKGEIERIYELPLLESFSLMSVTPKEALQVYFPEDLTDILTDIDSESLKPNKRSPLSFKKQKRIVDYQNQVICSYHFQMALLHIKELKSQFSL